MTFFARSLARVLARLLSVWPSALCSSWKYSLFCYCLIQINFLFSRWHSAARRRVIAGKKAPVGAGRKEHFIFLHILFAFACLLFLTFAFSTFEPRVGFFIQVRHARIFDQIFGQMLTGVFGPRVLGEEHPLLQFHRDRELQFYSSTGMGKQSMY